MFSSQAQLSLNQAFNEPIVGDVNTKMAFDSVGVLPLNRKQTVDLLIFHESFDFISFPIFLPCNKKLQEHWVIKLNIQTIK
jgi:hypothetical protein